MATTDDTTTNNPELTLEARQAIRAYLLKLFALPAIGISVVSFLLGWMIQYGAAGVALTKATDQILPQITEAASQAKVAKARAEEVLDDARTMREDLKQDKLIADAFKNKQDIATVVTNTLKPEILERLRGDASLIRYGDAIYISKVDGARDGFIVVNDARNTAGQFVQIFGPEQVNIPENSKFSIHQWPRR